VSADRAAVVTEAMSWLGTPYHSCADVKGAGVDCAMILVRVYAACGLIPADVDPRPYNPQWFLHSSETRYLNWLRKYAHEVASPQSGDLSLFKFGKQAAHGAIIVDEQSMIHAYNLAGRVIQDDRRSLAHDLHSHWSVFP
jgi:cell wall-associated NlpC family hydrolase